MGPGMNNIISNKESKLRQVITSSWFLAAIPSVLIILLLPAMGSLYRISVEQKGKSDDQFFYSDMNSDGLSELIFSGKGLPYHFISVEDQALRIYDQWNL